MNSKTIASEKYKYVQQRNIQCGLLGKQKNRFSNTQLLTKTRLIEHRFLLIDECTNLAAKLVEGLSGYATDGNICNCHSYQNMFVTRSSHQDL